MDARRDMATYAGMPERRFGLDPHPRKYQGSRLQRTRWTENAVPAGSGLPAGVGHGRWFSSRIQDQAVISSATSARNRLSAAASSRDRPSRLHLVLGHPVPRMPSLTPRSAWRAAHADSRASRGVLFRERRRRRAADSERDARAVGNMTP